MGTSKLTDKLEDFFDLSKSKQKKKHDKLLKIIQKLEEKKSSLEQKVIKESGIDETSTRFHDLRKELNVVSKLIKKAKKKNTLE
jgi:Mg2+ and Co2+ transporter CorA